MLRHSATGLLNRLSSMNKLTSRQRGLIITFLGVLIITPDALLLRLVEADHWTTMFWRGLFSVISLLAMNMILEKKSPLKSITSLPKAGFFCGLFFAISNICFVISITHTNAANTLVILASMPFIAAVLSVLVFRKNLPVKTWLSIAVAMTGIAIVFWGRIGGGNTFGDVFAFGSALSLASTLVILSIQSRVNSVVAIAVGSAVSSLVGLGMGGIPEMISLSDLGFLLLNGGIVIPLAMGMITYGPKLISASEVSILMLLETILGPVWVWLVLNEQPHHQTFYGGVLVVAAVLYSAYLSFQKK